MKNFTRDIPYINHIVDITDSKKVSVYLVGGFLRDCFLDCGKHCDFDFAVSKDSIKVARIFAKKIKGAFVLLDAEHRCARVAKKKGDALYTFDFADFRAKTLKGDLSHRDFTINTLCIDIKNIKNGKYLAKDIIDPSGAVKDLKKQTIRMTSARSFVEDPLRLLRAFSLQAILGFTIEKKTISEIKKKSDLINTVAYERIRDELFKILSSDHSSIVLRSMDTVGLLDRVIPQISVMYDVPQGGYHHLNVWAHSLETVTQIEKVFSKYIQNEEISTYLREPLASNRNRLSLMKLAALLHDIGKPDSRRIEKKRTLFHGHERIGKIIVKKIAGMLKLSTRERHALEDMVYWHLRPGYLSNFKMPTKKAQFRYFRDAKDEAISILLLSLADQQATRGPLTSKRDQEHHKKIIESLIDVYYKKRDEKPLDRLITGNDLIKSLRLKPSPLFSDILSKIEEEQALGEIKTKKDALAQARLLIKKYT